MGEAARRNRKEKPTEEKPLEAMTPNLRLATALFFQMCLRRMIVQLRAYRSRDKSSIVGCICLVNLVSRRFLACALAGYGVQEKTGKKKIPSHISSFSASYIALFYRINTLGHLVALYLLMWKERLEPQLEHHSSQLGTVMPDFDAKPVSQEASPSVARP